MDDNNEDGIPLMSYSLASNSKKQSSYNDDNNFYRASHRYEDDEFIDEGIIFRTFFKFNTIFFITLSD